MHQRKMRGLTEGWMYEMICEQSKHNKMLLGDLGSRYMGDHCKILSSLMYENYLKFLSNYAYYENLLV